MTQAQNIFFTIWEMYSKDNITDNIKQFRQHGVEIINLPKIFRLKKY